RDLTVTGVQTCALPISSSGSTNGNKGRHVWTTPQIETGRAGTSSTRAPSQALESRLVVRARIGAPRLTRPQGMDRARVAHGRLRSEERRVGKEWGAGRG